MVKRSVFLFFSCYVFLDYHPAWSTRRARGGLLFRVGFTVWLGRCGVLICFFSSYYHKSWVWVWFYRFYFPSRVHYWSASVRVVFFLYHSGHYASAGAMAIDRVICHDPHEYKQSMRYQCRLSEYPVVAYYDELYCLLVSRRVACVSWRVPGPCLAWSLVLRVFLQCNAYWFHGYRMITCYCNSINATAKLFLVGFVEIPLASPAVVNARRVYLYTAMKTIHHAFN